jgi:hypothetical protein
MHPNWKALSTVDFPRKIFVRPTENPNKALTETRSTESVESRGEEIRKFYEEVLSSESEPILKQENRSTSKPERRKRDLSFKVKEEFREKTEVDRNDLRNAFMAAQNDDLVKILLKFSSFLIHNQLI